MTDLTVPPQESPVAQALQPAVTRAFRPAAAVARPSGNRRRSSRAFSLVEVLVSLAILLTGIVAIASFFPTVLRSNRRAVDSSIAAYLAQLKAEEIRRDNDQTGVPGLQLTDVIRWRVTPTDAVAFAPDPRFAYSFTGRSLLHPEQLAGARVIVGYSATYRPRTQVLQAGDREILFELAF